MVCAFGATQYRHALGGSAQKFGKNRIVAALCLYPLSSKANLPAVVEIDQLT